ncbi:lamin tail domain-containing protein [Candidatus Woesearchaeota archaeon]|nr:lamin tail domain-containing protein [Candidatus Woesearchaeota archaeon]
MENRIARAMERMKKKERIKKNAGHVFILALMLLMPQLCFAASGQVVISEVLYDPTVTETGGEAVELYNPAGSAIDISGYAIKTESSATDAVVPDGTVLPAGAWYLIADTGWSTNRDDPGWPEADHEEPITMSNTDSGVALVAPNGTILDAVGWGDAAGIGAGLFEETPAAPAGFGESLQRTGGTDTDDNSIDITSAAPDLKNSEYSEPQPGGTDISLAVDIQNNAPLIETAEILLDEDTAAGIQIVPSPGDVKNVPIRVMISDADGTLASVTAAAAGNTVMLDQSETINFTTSTYEGTIPMQFYETAGEYTVQIAASDGSSNSSTNLTFNYLSMAAIYIDSSALQFTGATLGSDTEVRGDFALSTDDAPSIRNIGNTPLDFGLYGTDLTDGGNSIAVDNMRYSFDNNFDGPLSGALSITMQVLGLGLANSADSVTSLGFSLHIPSTTPNGNYTGSVTVVAVSS